MALSRQGGGPTVVLVGRPNVGKSTLFNRITRTRRSIVTSIAGTTRDVIALPEWEGQPFTLIDTGGMFGASEDPLHELVVTHGRRALERADIVVFVVDGREGLVPGDEEIAAALRALGVPVLVAVNKTDDKRARGRVLEFYRLGLEPLAKGWAICWTRWSRAFRTGGRPGRFRSRRPRSPSRSSGVRTSASPPSSTGSCARSGRSSARCRGRRGTRWTPC
jgi:small GTP-binding protein